MAGQNYQDRGAVRRTQLITIRVAPEERQALHRAAREHGETLSRMLLSPWLACDGMQQQASGRADHVAQTDTRKPCEAEAPRAPSTTTSAASSSVTEKADTTQLRARQTGSAAHGSNAIPGQQSLFGVEC